MEISRWLWSARHIDMMRLLKFLAIGFAATASLVAEVEPVTLNSKAPDFEVLDKDGKKVKLSDYSGKNVVLTFSRAHW